MRKITYFLLILTIFTGCGKESKDNYVKESNQFRQFDIAPIPKSPIAPTVNINHSGTSVMVQFFVSSNGKASRSKILNSSGNNTIDQAAMSAIENTPFTPASLDGETVAVTTELEILFPASQNKTSKVVAITRDELDNVYTTQVANALKEVTGLKLSDKQKLDFSINFQAQISESDIEVNALFLEEEISFLKNEIQNFIYHMNNEDGSLQNGVQLYRSTSQVRITLIDMDGDVLAESHLEENDISKMDNHGDRPEIIAAKTSEYGVATRYSETLNKKLLYVAHGYEEEDDSRRIYVRFSKTMQDINEDHALRIYEQELLKALAESDINIDSSQKKTFLATFLLNMKSKLAEKNIDSDLKKNEEVVRVFTLKLEEKSQEIAEHLKLEVPTVLEYLKEGKNKLQLSSETYAQSSDIRITLIDKDGVVIADSELNKALVKEMQNHQSRPEVAQSNTLPYGIISRFSNTMQQKFVYVCHRLSEPMYGIQYVRLARSVRADYSQIKINIDKIVELYQTLIAKSLSRSGVDLSASQDRNFKNNFKTIVLKRNRDIKLNHKIEQYRLYIEEINKTFDKIKLELNEDDDNTFFKIYQENVIREFGSSSDIDVVANESAVRTYFNNMELKSKQKKRSDLKDGPVITYHTNGRVKQKGQYIAGEKDGDWMTFTSKGKLTTIITYKNGNIVKTENPGSIQDSVIYHDNGRIKMQGLTNSGMRHGEWKRYDRKGKLLTITIYDFGKIISQENPGAIEDITLYHDNGRLKAEGMIRDKKREGVWKFYNSRGIHVKNVTYTNGTILKTISLVKESGPKLREGTAVTYHDNGRIKETGRYSKGKKDGEWKEYDSRGKLLKIKIYNKGKVINEQSRQKIKPFISYHNNGRIKEKGMLKNGKRNGEWLLYSTRGKLIRTTSYLNGEIVDKSNSGLVGPVTNYYENGFIKEEGIINNGERDGVWKIYNEDGSHVENIIYKNGKIIKKDKV